MELVGGIFCTGCHGQSRRKEQMMAEIVLNWCEERLYLPCEKIRVKKLTNGAIHLFL